MAQIMRKHFICRHTRCFRQLFHRTPDIGAVQRTSRTAYKDAPSRYSLAPAVLLQDETQLWRQHDRAHLSFVIYHRPAPVYGFHRQKLKLTHTKSH
ncbi:Uncharacterised protein [uncultured Clostridium sp.]|nr:Uncharacterised protein [uncultured Clostridium sp.]